MFIVSSLVAVAPTVTKGIATGILTGFLVFAPVKAEAFVPLLATPPAIVTIVELGGAFITGYDIADLASSTYDHYKSNLTEDGILKEMKTPRKKFADTVASEMLKDKEYNHATEKGNVGEELAAQTHEAKGKTRLKSHYGGGHGPDNVYVDRDGKVYIEEVKVDRSSYKPEQMSDEQLKKWIKEMKKHPKENIREIAKLLEDAMGNGKLVRIYTRVDTTAGTITRNIVNKLGQIEDILDVTHINEKMVLEAFRRTGVLGVIEKITNSKTGKAVYKVADWSITIATKGKVNLPG